MSRDLGSESTSKPRLFARPGRGRGREASDDGRVVIVCYGSRLEQGSLRRRSFGISNWYFDTPQTKLSDHDWRAGYPFIHCAPCQPVRDRKHLHFSFGMIAMFGTENEQNYWEAVVVTTAQIILVYAHRCQIVASQSRTCWNPNCSCQIHFHMLGSLGYHLLLDRELSYWQIPFSMFNHF